MLASPFLTIAAAEHARRPAPADQAPLTRNEIAHLLATLTSPRTTPGTGSAGPAGDDATSAAPAHATTSGKPCGNEVRARAGCWV
jgi:hypothetical protein